MSNQLAFANNIFKYRAVCRLPKKEGNRMPRENSRLEDYLRRIHSLSRKNPVHAADLARDLGVSRATVCVFIKQLQEEGYVSVGEHHIITLTPRGAKIAEATCQRLDTVRRLLEGLGVPGEIAARDALEIERNLSQQSYEAFQRFNERNGAYA